MLTSPSRLHMRLLCMGHRDVTAIAIKHLLPLPITVDYPLGAWTTTMQECMVSALAHPDRVCGIAFEAQGAIPKELLAAMNQPFPALDSLELRCLPTLDLNLPPPFLTVQPPHLRRLGLSSITPTSLCHILSCTMSLVDLTLRLDRLFLSPSETQILSHIQGMPLLRRLKLEIREWSHRSDTRLHPPSRTKDVLLPKLNFVCFTGHVTQLEGLMACLEAPSLQALRITLPDTSPLLLAPRLSKFLRNRGKSFSCAQIHASTEGINLFMVTPTHPPFKFIVNASTSLEQLGHVFSATLARVQVVFLTSPFIPMSVPPLAAHFRWCTFFTAFCNAKTLRISHGIESNVLDIFYLGHREFSLDILPALKEIELNATMHPDSPTQVDEHRQAAILGLFKPLVDAGKEEGHTVNVHWNTDRVHPKYFYDMDTDM